MKKISLKKITGSVTSWIISGSHDHYKCEYPVKTGLMTSTLFNFLFSGIKLSEEQSNTIKSLKEDGIVVYINKYKSLIDFYLIHHLHRKNNLPTPSIAFNYNFTKIKSLTALMQMFYAHIDYFVRFFKKLNPFENGYFNDKIFKESTAFLSLIDKKIFYRIYVEEKTDPLTFLLKLQEKTEKTIYLVPRLVYYNRKPDRNSSSIIDFLFGSKENPGRLRKVAILLKGSHKVFTETSDILSLNEFIKRDGIKDLDSSSQSIILRKDLIKLINQHRQSVTGPVLKSRQEIKENILTEKCLTEFIKEHSEETDKPLSSVYKKSSHYINEISANYNPNMIRVFEIFLDWMFKTMFDGISIDTKGLEKLKSASKKAPLILMPCHKSHLDYLIISYLFQKNNLPCPHIAAGKNLSFWPLGYIFRGSGAFFLRRTFKGHKLYSKIFISYLENLIKEGFNIEFFIEGGRSRSGKLLSPKLGLLNYIIEAYKKNISDDLMFVPIYIGYDRVIEEKAYLHEIEGGNKEPENLTQVLKARKLLSKKYGKVYLKFNDPISLKDYLEKKHINLDEADKDIQREFNRSLGYKFVNSINEISIVTAYGIVAGTLLNLNRKSFTNKYIKAQTLLYLNYLISQNVELADTLMLESDKSIGQVINTFEHRKFIENISLPNEQKDIPEEDKQYKLIESRRPGLDYYKNNCINHFIPASYTALSILANEAFQFVATDLHKTYEFLQSLFIDEFSYNEEYDSQYMVRKNLKAFINDGIIVPHSTLPDTYNITSKGFSKLKNFAYLLKTYFESYWIVLRYIELHKINLKNRKENIRKIQTFGNKMYKNGEITRIEAISTINFINGLSIFEKIGIRSRDDKDKIAEYSDVFQNCMNYLS